jgi:hypothetical protein
VSQTERGRGWGMVVLLALATMVLSVVQPALLIFVPLALLFVALPPRRPVQLALAALIGWLAFRDVPIGGPVWYFERGWALLLGAWFVLMVALRPTWRFLPRALAALGGTALTATAVILASRGGFAELDYALSEQLRSAASGAVAGWSRLVGLDRVSEDVTRAVHAAAELQVKLYPAMLGLASLAALGVAWWAFGRVAHGERAPLGPLREFRFRDEMVWLLIGSIVLLGLPLDALTTRIGENLLTFMAVLYALRGAAVLLVIGGVPGPLGLAVGALLVVLLYPIVMATTFLVGLSDTWLDLRKRREQAMPPPPGS